jgi:hypothetical protein
LADTLGVGENLLDITPQVRCVFLQVSGRQSAVNKTKQPFSMKETLRTSIYLADQEIWENCSGPILFDMENAVELSRLLLLSFDNCAQSLLRTENKHTSVGAEGYFPSSHVSVEQHLAVLEVSTA